MFTDQVARILAREPADPSVAPSRWRPYVEITSSRDGRAHQVPDALLGEALASGTGLFPALCGQLLTAAPLTSPPGPPCLLCMELTRPRRRSRRRAQLPPQLPGG